LMESEISIDLQVATSIPISLAQAEVERWVAAALDAADHAGRYEVSVRIVDDQESQSLNKQYRDKDSPTNVLSFPFEMLDGLPDDIVQPLGDLVICEPVIGREATEQGKDVNAHRTHMVIHGTLHLLGYDHQTDEHAATMETLEIGVLQKFGIENPYIDNHTQ
jgi:probable rRNA maturation factor